MVQVLSQWNLSKSVVRKVHEVPLELMLVAISTQMRVFQVKQLVNNSKMVSKISSKLCLVWAGTEAQQVQPLPAMRMPTQAPYECWL